MKRYDVGERYEVPDGDFVKYEDAAAAIKAAVEAEREALAVAIDQHMKNQYGATWGSGDFIRARSQK